MLLNERTSGLFAAYEGIRNGKDGSKFLVEVSVGDAQQAWVLERQTIPRLHQLWMEAGKRNDVDAMFYFAVISSAPPISLQPACTRSRSVTGLEGGSVPR
jgi:hypothetical protein